MNQEHENQIKLSNFFSDEYQSLKNYVRSRINDTTDNDAEDIVQEVALKLFSRTSSSPIDNIAGFVYRSIRNKIIDVMRTRKHSIHHEPTLEQLWTEFTEQFYANSEIEYSDEMKNRLKSAITKLKPVYRDIIVAVDFEGFTYREIAERTGISQGTLLSRRHRALSILSKELETDKTKKNGT